MGNLRNQRSLRTLRRALRSSLTPAEARMWTLLRSSSIGSFKFRRQHSVGPYILDFFCPERDLAVELDGHVHFNPDQQDADEARTRYLSEMGICVIRFENRLVFECEEWVLEEIRRKLENTGD